MSGEERREAVPAGYKMTEVGVIPEDWGVRPLGDLYSFQNGYNTDGTAYGSGVRFVNVLEPITYSHLSLEDLVDSVHASEQIVASYRVKSGDVVFNRTSETRDELGLAAVFEGRETAIFGGFVIRGRPRTTDVDPIYSGYALRSQFIRRQIIPMGQGAIRANIGQTELRRVLFPLPPLPEQRAIAEALSDVDNLLDALDRLIDKKRAVKQAAMQQLLTGKTRLPGFAGEWEETTLGEIARTRNERVWPQTISPTLPCIELEHIGVATGTLHDASIAGASISMKAVFESGDVLFGRLRPYLRKFWLATENGVCSTEIWPIIAAPNRLVSYYLAQFVRTDAFIDKASIAFGSHMPRAEWKTVSDMELRLPPLPEQRAIAEVLSDMDDEITALEKRRDITRRIKEGMMQQLLTGRVRLVPRAGADAPGATS